MFPSSGENRSANRQADPPGVRGAQLGWGFAWPSNRRILYNRVSADPQGRPWSERKKYIWWDAAQGKWVGLDVPDFPLTKPLTAQAIPGATGMDAHSGTDAFILKPDGVGWLYVPVGLMDGPLPTHYEPVESVVQVAVWIALFVSLGPAVRGWFNVWGIVLAIGLAIGIVLPLIAALRREPLRTGVLPVAAMLVLAGGIMVRTAIVFVPEVIAP